MIQKTPGSISSAHISTATLTSPQREPLDTLCSLIVPFICLRRFFVCFQSTGVRYLSSGRDSDRLLDTVGGGGVDLLAGLGDLLEDGLVGEAGDDLGFLVFEGDFVALNAFTSIR